MRLILIFLFVFSFHSLIGQDKAILQKQLLQILVDYPNEFKNLTSPGEAIRLKFDISGTNGNSLISKMGGKTYVSAMVSLSGTAEENKKIFEKWVNLLDQINFNGVKMIGAPTCSSNCGEYVVYSKKWAFDSNRDDLDHKYLPFKIRLEMLDVEGVYTVGMHIGEVDE